MFLLFTLVLNFERFRAVFHQQIYFVFIHCVKLENNFGSLVNTITEYHLF